MARYNRIMNPIKTDGDYRPSDAMLAYHRLGDNDINRNIAIQDMALCLCALLSERERESTLDVFYAARTLTDDETAFLAHFVWADSRQWLSVLS